VWFLRVELGDAGVKDDRVSQRAPRAGHYQQQHPIARTPKTFNVRFIDNLGCI
jgi:hypothetical protein